MRPVRTIRLRMARSPLRSADVSSPSKVKGTRFETAIVNYLNQQHTDVDMEPLGAVRLVQTGNADQGDIQVAG